MIIAQVVLNNGDGLHARPASDLVREAASFESEISLRNASLSSDWVDAKSILSVLGLGVENNHVLEIKADGPDDKDAVQSLKQLVENNFTPKAE
jgi:phosphotransferase system HPr (HPr) family protein